MTETSTKGEAVRDQLHDLGVLQYIVLASTPDTVEGGFSLLMGEMEMVTSLLTMFFRSYPEIFVSVVATIMKISSSVTDEQLAENLAKQGEGCNCDGCKGESKGENEINMNDFIAKGKLN